MRPFLIQILLALSMGLTGCAWLPGPLTEAQTSHGASAETYRHQLMLGKWYGQRTLEDGVEREWLTERGSRGEYRVLFKDTHPDGRVELQTEFGLWGISGDVYFSIFLGWIDERGVTYADSSNPLNYDAYHILSLETKAFFYRNARSATEYRVKKVGEEFTLGKND